MTSINGFCQCYLQIIYEFTLNIPSDEINTEMFETVNWVCLKTYI